MIGVQHLVPGDRVRTYKGFVFQHPVIYIGDGRFIEKSPLGVVRIRHASEFPSQNFVCEFRPPPHLVPIVIARAMSRLGPDPYDLFSANCPHFVNEVFSGKRQSEQVEALKAVALLAGAIVALGALASA